MFLDMVGFTALMQSDEVDAKLRQQRLREVLDINVGLYKGRNIQFYGDGALTIFSSTINCVHCALEIQRTLRKTPQVDVRIGLHVGDIITDDSGVYGDGINIASRLETLAIPGSIIISDRVYEDIRNQGDILTKDLGFFTMKHVRQPLRVHVLANDGLAIPGRHEITGKTRLTAHSIVVLPFMNMSQDPENEYFSDGITEELINALAGVEELDVISRTTSFALKGKNEDVRLIGSQLNVSRILEGSVRRAGNRVRITAQLINSADGFHIWSETFDRDLVDIFKVQDEISQIITNRLRAKLLPEDKEELLVKAPTSNFEAYGFYLKGKYYQNRETPDDASRAIENYREAIALQPDFALPYAMIAGCYALLGTVGVMPASTAIELMKENVDISLRLDPELSEAYVAKATVQLFFEWKWDAAFHSLTKANELSPGNMTVIWILGYYYLFVDNAGQAIEHLEHVCRLDPLAVAPSRTLGFAYFFAERYADSVRLAETQLEMVPDNWFALCAKAFGTGMLGDWHQALALFSEAHEISGGAPMAKSYLAFCLGQLGRTSKAMQYINELEAFHQTSPALAKYCDLFIAWWGNHMYDKAFEALNHAIDRKEEIVAFVINSPVLRNIRQDPRYLAARVRMGFQNQ